MHRLSLVMVILAASCSKNTHVDEPLGGYSGMGAYDYLPGCSELEEVAALSSSCLEGIGVDCLYLGHIYHDGESCAVDLAAAATAYGNGCDRYSGESCYRYALMIEQGEHPERSGIQDTLRFFFYGCEDLHDPSCSKVEEYVATYGMQADLEGLLDEIGCYDRYMDFLDGYYGYDLSFADFMRREAEDKADYGDVSGLVALGYLEAPPDVPGTDTDEWMESQSASMLETTVEEPGTDFPYDDHDSECMKGNAASCYEVGLYELQEKLDPMQALPYLRKSCKSGFWKACTLLEESCDMGFLEACEIPQSGASLEAGSTETKKGELTVSDVDEVSKKNKSEIRECYKEHFEEHPGVDFDVAVNLKIDKKGSAKKTELFTAPDYPVAYCILYAVRNWAFPESKKGLEAMYGWKAKKFK